MSTPAIFAALSEGIPCLSASVSSGGICKFTCAAAYAASEPIYQNFDETTALNIGSLTEIFLAAIFVKLMESGACSIYDCVQQVLPEYPFSDTTLLQLFLHTSGADPFCCSPHDAVSDICKLLRHTYEPNTELRYFPAAMPLLMECIRRISGTDAAVLAKDMILGPLEMTHSSFSPADIPNSIPPYDPITDTVTRSQNGLYTTAEDILVFVDDVQNACHKRPAKVFTKWSADFLLRTCSDAPFSVTPAFLQKGNSLTPSFFSDFCTASACGRSSTTGCLVTIDPVYDISLVLLSNSTALNADWSIYRRLSNDLFGQILL